MMMDPDDGYRMGVRIKKKKAGDWPAFFEEFRLRIIL